MPFPPGNLGEGHALRTFAGRGAVELLKFDDDTGQVLMLERALPQTLADHAATEDYPVEEATAGLGGPAAPPDRRTPDAHSGWAQDQARETIEHLATERTTTMIHGDCTSGTVTKNHGWPLIRRAGRAPRRSTRSRWSLDDANNSTSAAASTRRSCVGCIDSPRHRSWTRILRRRAAKRAPSAPTYINCTSPRLGSTSST